MKLTKLAPVAAIRKDAESTVFRAPNRPGLIACSKCGLAKAPEEFSRHKGHSTGRSSVCKMCIKVYREAHKDEERTYGAAYRAAHKNRIRKRDAAYREAYKDKIRKYSAARYAADKEGERKRVAVWAATHKERNRKSYSIYYKVHKDEILKRLAAYRKANPERFIVSDARGRHKRRSREEQLPATLTVQEWRTTLKAFNNRCAYCGGEGPFHKDHVIPVSKGGGLEAGNIVPACPACNLSKHSYGAQAWMKRKGYDYDRFATKLADCVSC